MNKSVTEKKNTAISLVFLALGLFVAIGILSALTHFTEQPWLMIAAGSTGLLLFAYPSSPFSQTRNVVGGHMLATLIGIACLQWLGADWWSLGIATALSAVTMIHFNVVHPPAASNPLVIYFVGSSWSFVFFPMLFGAVALVLCAKLYWFLYKRFI